MGDGMMAVNQQVAPRTVVVGLGDSGFACVRHLQAAGGQVMVLDTRQRPPHAERLRRDYPDVPGYFGGLPSDWLIDADQVVLSPGIDPRLPALQPVVEAGIPVIGEIELFARSVNAPVMAITGSNGKSTVTTMIGAMAEAAGVSAAVGGNLGPPALDLLHQQPDASLFILELSSFQLESTQSLQPMAAAVLNLSPDHLDRYDGVSDYADAKARILKGAELAILNADDPMVTGMAKSSQTTVWFSSEGPSRGARWTLDGHRSDLWISRAGERFLPVTALAAGGRHNAVNAMAALALGEAAGFSADAMCLALREFRGLPHRMECLGQRRGRLWINDSKATNVGAAVAAVASVDTPVVLVAGGDGKGQRFQALAAALQDRGRAAVVYGKDREEMAAALRAAAPVDQTTDLDEAVNRALALSRPGDTVLLSPACASLDQFSSYRARGARFRELVEELHDDV